MDTDTTTAAPTTEGPSLVVASKVKEYIKSKGDYQVSADFIAEVNVKLSQALEGAIKRCVTNGRKTLRPQDF